jgi:hypothetical protein
MNPDPIPVCFKPILVYRADPSHTADPVGPIITDPSLATVLPDDVYVVSWVVPVGSPGGYVCLSPYGRERQLLEDGTLLPPKGRHLIGIDEVLFTGGGGLTTRTSWSPRCRRR